MKTIQFVGILPMRKSENQSIMLFIAIVLLIVFAVAIVHAQQPFISFIEISESGLQGVAWSPDGQRLAVAVGNDVKLLTSNLEITSQFQGHTAKVNRVAWSSDGTKLASASDDTSVRIWDVVVGSPTFGNTLSILQHTHEVYSVAWSPAPNDNRLGTITLDSVVSTSESAFVYTNVEIWDIDTTAVVHTLSEQVNIAPWLAWSSDGSQLAIAHLTGELGYRVSVWNTATGQHQ
jgi:WD40 repeat protein